MGAVPKITSIEAPEHLAPIRQMRCVACNAPPPSVAHHLRMSRRGGVSKKPGDDYAVPLCHGCHSLLHAVPELQFWLGTVETDREALREIVCGYAKSLYAVYLEGN